MEIPVEYVIAGFVAMGAAITWLAKDQADSKRNAQAAQKRCEAEGAECRKKQSDLDGFIRTTLLNHATEAGNREAVATAELARARHVLDRVEKRFPADDDQTPAQPARAHA
jgi:putative Ca2+/H+ antiporter (TMEM165/GDT1 family)